MGIELQLCWLIKYYPRRREQTLPKERISIADYLSVTRRLLGPGGFLPFTPLWAFPLFALVESLLIFKDFTCQVSRDAWTHVCLLLE